MKALKALLLQAFVVAIVVAGFIYGVEGAQYMAKFFVWGFFLPLSIIALTNDVVKKLAAEEQGNVIVRHSGRVVNWSALGVFVWTGNIFTALAWAACMFFMALSRELVNKARAAGTEPVTVDG